jgi:hypothetical protein
MESCSSSCENIMFLKCLNEEHKENIMRILSEGVKLFESFIILQGTKIECYGTSSDVYIEYIQIDHNFSETIIKIDFTTYETAPLQFCKNLSHVYSLDIQLIYFNEINNYSGKFCVEKGKVNCNEILSYYQGLYIYIRDRFWTEIENSFQENENYNVYIQRINICLYDMDTHYLKDLFDKYNLFKSFEKM